MREFTRFLLLLLLLFPLGCGGDEKGADPGPEPRLRLATTTSTRDSGLLDVLIPVFEHENGCKVDVVAVGTGAALKLGENGDADVVLVHARKAEEAFLAAGHAKRHEEFMVNHFLIVGPEDDPAGIRGQTAVEAFRRMAQSGATFVSRGDDSGTHKMEKGLRKEAGLEGGWPGLIESGQGMGPTLLMADEKNAHTLVDGGTWLARKKTLRLAALLDRAADLRNPYSVMPVDPTKHPGLKSELAERFADFLISKRAQTMIGDFKIDGESLFTPTRI